MASLWDYVEITKPGIIAGNAVTLIGGFFLASRGRIDAHLFLLTFVGIALVIASACAFNNVIDRDIDTKMERTKDRAIASGRISPAGGTMTGFVLGFTGFATLALFVDLTAAAVAAVGFFFYLFPYSLWSKRETSWSTVIGSVAGATPPVAGYAAASGRIDFAAFLLFVIMIAWQMPHFYAIAIRRRNDYADARVPALPVGHGLKATKIQILLYIIAFTLLAPSLTVFGYTGIFYFTIAIGLSLLWLILAIRGLLIPDTSKRNIAWAHQMFNTSLIVMMILFLTIAVTSI